MRGLLGNAYAVSGNRTDAEKIVAELKSLWPEHARAALDLAVVFSGLGDKENAREMHVTDLIGIGQDSHFVEVRRDRRFQPLVQRVGAPK